jgi:hypothetical protein
MSTEQKKIEDELHRLYQDYLAAYCARALLNAEHLERVKVDISFGSRVTEVMVARALGCHDAEGDGGPMTISDFAIRLRNHATIMRTKR